MPLISAIVGSKLAIGLIALGTVTVGGGAAAAYTGSLPAPLQTGAHALIGAPAPQSDDDPTAAPSALPTSTPTAEPTDTPTAEPTATPTPTAEPVGPDATGASAFGLCTAWAHGGLGAHSVALANLSKAAGGSAGIAAYCTTVSAGKAAEHGSTDEPTSTPDPVETEAPETEATHAPEPSEDETHAPVVPTIPEPEHTPGAQGHDHH